MPVRVLGVFFIFVFFFSQAFAATQLSLQGRILNSDGSGVISANVSFRVQIRSPGAENCLLFEETHNALDLSQTDGAFSLNIGTGIRSAANVDGGNSLEKVFSNQSSINLSAASNPCSYTPSAKDERKLVYSFNAGTGWETVPAIAINYVPRAIEAQTAQTLGNLGSSNVVRVENAGVPGVAPALTTTQATELVNLLNGVSTVYIRPINAVFSNAPKSATAPTANDDLVNKAYVDAQVAAGLPAIGTAGTYTKVTTDAQGRVTSGATLAEADIPNLTTAGKVSGNAINAGTIGGNAAINTTGSLVTGGTVSANIVSGNQVRVYNGSNYIQLQAPVLGGNTTYTLPAADGTGGYVLSTNGSGTLSWIAPTTFGSQTARTVYAAPQGASGAPSFRLLNISDVRSSVAGDFLTGGACTSGQALTYNSVSDNISCSTILPTIANTANLANGRVWIGDGTGKAQEQTISGDVNIDNAGVATVATGTGNNQIVRLNGTAQLPAVDGRNLTNLDQNTNLNANYFKQNGNSFGGAATLGTNEAQPLNFETDSTTRMTILANGNVGVGTASPAAALSVQGAGLLVLSGNDPAAAVSAPFLQPAAASGFSANPVYSFWYQSSTGISNPALHTIGLFTNGSEKMRVTSGGAVAIGSTSANASAILDITSQHRWWLNFGFDNEYNSYCHFRYNFR
jgi:hypothetical protein